VVSDLIRAAAEQFQFTPQRPSSEVEFKRAYARYARAAGLTPEQAVRVYSFETGGTGNYDVQAGIEHGGKRAISTAMGYNQLLTTNTVELLAEQGHEFVRDLTERVARTQGPARKAMEHKLAVLKKMVAFTRTVPDDWSAYQRLADTPQGWACHAMVLDIDIGPMLQTHKLLTSVIFARNKGYGRPLTAAQSFDDAVPAESLSHSIGHARRAGQRRTDHQDDVAVLTHGIDSTTPPACSHSRSAPREISVPQPRCRAETGPCA
jgi:hypothetical protein